MLYYDRTNISEGIDLNESSDIKNALFVIRSWIMNSNFKIIYAIVVIILDKQYCYCHC